MQSNFEKQSIFKIPHMLAGLLELPEDQVVFAKEIYKY